MQADLAFDDGRTGRITCALVVGDAAEALDPGLGGSGRDVGVQRDRPAVLQPGHGSRDSTGTTKERVRGGPTYEYQLQAFADAVLRDGPVLTPPSDSIANMRVIDAVYDAAGLARRGGAGGAAVNAIDGLDTDRAAVYLARARFGIGLALLAAPGLAATIWAGRGVGRRRRPLVRPDDRACVKPRSVPGASIAIGQGRGGGDWVSMLAVSDAGDAVVSLLTPGLPVRARAHRRDRSGIGRRPPQAREGSRRRPKRDRRRSRTVEEMTLRGRLLVATPQLVDPNFSRTVVLVLDHGDDGAFGVVLNRATDTPGG